jgi:hypothetical protein
MVSFVTAMTSMRVLTRLAEPDKVGGAFLGGNHRLFRAALMIQEAAGNVRKRYILPQL